MKQCYTYSIIERGQYLSLSEGRESQPPVRLTCNCLGCGSKLDPDETNVNLGEHESTGWKAIKVTVLYTILPCKELSY